MSAYAVNTLCRRVVYEPDLREALRGDPETAAAALRAASPPLTDDEASALLAGDVGRLSQDGASDFLLTMLARWNVLGLDIPTYADRIRAAYPGQQSGPEPHPRSPTPRGAAMSREFWPDGARMVVSLSLMFEAGGRPPQLVCGLIGDGHTTGEAPPPEIVGRYYPELPNETMIEYGFREGIPRLLDVFDRRGVKVSSFMVGAAVEAHPELAREIVERGHEAAAHGRTHTAQYHLSREDEHAFIRDGVESVERHTGVRPLGYNAWALRRSPNTLSILQELGFLYHIDDISRDEPFVVPVDGQDFVVVPYTRENNDIHIMALENRSVVHYERQLRLSFDQLYMESEHRRRLMVVSTHDRFAGRPAPARILEEFIAYAQGHPGVAFLRKDEIARYTAGSPLTPREPRAT